MVRKGEGKMDGEIGLNELLVRAPGRRAAPPATRIRKKSRKRIRMTDESDPRGRGRSKPTLRKTSADICVSSP